MKRNDKQLYVSHFIDSVYLGQLNNSYQKNGFGIVQNFKFDTYFGTFRNNMAEGLGLVVFNDGLVVYANFVRDQVDGLIIIDDKQQLKCGIYRQGVMVGVGFQYQYSTKKWSMIQFHKGFAMDTLKQQEADIQVSLPKIIKIQQSLFFHLYNYLQSNFFPNQEIQIGNQQPCESLTLCYLNEDKQMFGPGLKMIGNVIVQVGFYQKGLLNGFGKKRDIQKNSLEIGRYYKGRKIGIFYEQKGDKIFSNQYRKDMLIRSLEHPISIQDLGAQQKKYNYNSKTFFSAKITFPFNKISHIKTYNPMIQKLQNPVLNSNLNKKQVNYKITEKPKRKTQLLNTKWRQKSSRDIMKQKINMYIRGVGESKSKSKIGRIQDKKSKTQVKESDNQQDIIAQEQNPFK